MRAFQNCSPFPTWFLSLLHLRFEKKLNEKLSNEPKNSYYTPQVAAFKYTQIHSVEPKVLE